MKAGCGFGNSVMPELFFDLLIGFDESNKAPGLPLP
jgi:hypothetical protein